ncbi:MULTISPECIES: hypothetical protein [unclassified Micromonospora]|uniref:hypothetical protein n=1 Tax=unclassified Micromonospora TaxID=2617518 RepID=UPI0033D862EA
MEGPTALIPVVPESPPVFVDPSGRRRRWLRRLAYCAGAAGAVYTIMVGVSFAGGPITPATVIPFVEETTEQRLPSSKPTTSPAPTVTRPTPDTPADIRTAPARTPVTSVTPGGTVPPSPRSARPTRSAPSAPTVTRPAPGTTAPPTAPTAEVPPPVVDPPPAVDPPAEPVAPAAPADD